MAMRSSHDNTLQHQETSRLFRLLCVNPIDRIPLLELKRAIHTLKQPLPASDTNLKAMSQLRVGSPYREPPANNAPAESADGNAPACAASLDN